jgi:hypothetical protein
MFALSSAFATIRYVDPGHYTTINLAYNDAVNGDTLLLAASTFNESLMSSKRLTILGSGTSLTIMNGTVTLNTGSNGTVIEGMAIVSNYNTYAISLAAAVDSIAIRRCRTATVGDVGYACIFRIGDANGGRLYMSDCTFEASFNDGRYAPRPLIALLGDSTIVLNCIFASAPTGGVHATHGVGGSPRSLAMEGCVFLQTYEILQFTGSFPFFFVNNILYDQAYNPPHWGTYPAASTWNYNASAGALPPGDNAILLTQNPFVNSSPTNHYVFGTSDLHLDPTNGLPCINAGDPNQHDLDGSRSDLGIYGGQSPFIDSGAPNYPFVSSFTVPPSVTVGQTLPIQSQGRIGRGY